jgi:HemY protein
MNRILFWLLMTVLIAVSIGLIAHRFGAGYVVFSFADVSIETSFMFFISFTVICFILFHYFFRILGFLINLPRYFKYTLGQKRSEKARQSLIKGLIDISEGRFADAEKILLKQAADSDTAMLNYLIAARAAQQQGAYDRRDEYLRLAQESAPQGDIAVGITKAELQLAHRQYDQALTTLNELGEISPKHNYVKKLLARVYERLGDWPSLSNMLDDLRKSEALPEDALSQTEVETYCGLLRQFAKQNKPDELNQLWHRVPKHLKSNSDVLQIYVEQLIAQDDHKLAEELIRNHLDDDWHEPLVLLYGQLNVERPQQLLESAEHWLATHRRSAVLLLVLGKLCLKIKLWGKARTYLETSLGIKPMAETYLLLAMLLEDKMGEHDKAQSLYQQGLKLAVSAGICTDALTEKTSA